MNKPQIKNFSVWARRKLIETVSYRMSLIGITENGIAEALPQSTADLKFYDIGTATPAEVKGKDIIYRNELATKVNENGFNNTVEEIAYTWFNRLIAIRFMEVNDYLPSRVRVLSSLESGKNEPDIITDAVNVASSEGFDITADEIYMLKDENRVDELFGKMFLFQCSQLSECLPELFEKTADYMNMLLPVSYTDKDGIIRHLVDDILEDDFNLEKEGQVEIIGWLYQYYNTEPKDAVFAALKKNVKITKENIPAATQLFTPDWIVRYMVENSLGRLWIEHLEVNSGSVEFPVEFPLSFEENDSTVDTLKKQWKYYLEEAEQEESVKAQLEEIRSEYKNLNPEEIKFIDPCMGSGHILVYAFDVLMQIYASCGYSERDAAQLIIQKNLHGLDIDRRAYQLAYFALMMKARQYDRRFLTRGIKPNLAHFQGLESIHTANVDGAIKELTEQFRDCDTYGSLLVVSDKWSVESREGENSGSCLIDRATNLPLITDDYIGVIGMEFDKTERMMTIYKILSQKYDVVCTNPPYMGGSGMSAKLSEFVKDNYPDSKSDLFAVFIERCGGFAKKNGYYAMITQHAFMFLSSYEKLRAKLMHKTTINMAHLGARAFDEIGGEVVQTTAFVNYNSHINDYKGTYARLVDIAGENEKKELFLSGNNRHTAKQENFSKIPGAPVAYWVSEKFMSTFRKTLGDVCEIKKGSDTGENDRYVRIWYEVDSTKVAFTGHSNKWIVYIKGGESRKWYGHLTYVVNWENDGYEIRNDKRSTIRNEKYFYRSGITWTDVGSKGSTFRFFPKDCLRDNRGPAIFSDITNYLLGLLNSKVCIKAQGIVNPTICFQAGSAKAIPFMLNNTIKKIVDDIAENNICISKDDWDSFETSWDFKRHPLLEYASFTPQEIAEDKEKHISDMGLIRDAFELWESECNTRFDTLKSNEEELNRIFIDIYGLQDELTPEVEDKDVTVRKADLQREIKSLISYAVGCMFGRYSLDTDGLAYAGGDWDDSKYTTFVPDKDNCLIITDELYFNNEDIVSRFCEFIKVVYGEETLEENLNFIADALGSKGKTSREVIRNYFLSDFIKDHIKTYQKRPIYWLFDSGKQNGFKALVYMHRWNADTIGNVRVEYLHKVQKVYQSEIDRMQDTIENSTDGREVTAATKAKEKLAKQLKETRDYDVSMAHLANMRINIDL